MFNENIEVKDMAIYDVVYPDIEKPMIARGLPVLASYLSLTDGLLGVESTLNNDDEAVIRIYYSKMKVNEEKIRSVLTQKKWKIMMKGNVEKEIDPAIPFS
jgi:hypothetical protein